MEKLINNDERMKGTMKGHPGFNAEADATTLKNAMKGMGTDEKAIVEVLGRRNLKQRLEIKENFKTMFGQDLIGQLRSEVSGDFCHAVTSSVYDPEYYDAYSLHKAMSGAGTKESTLTEILTSRTNAQITKIKEAYLKYFNTNLEKDVESETSGFYKRVLVSCLQARKPELTPEQEEILEEKGPNAIIDINQAKKDVEDLYNAGEKKLGTDEAVFLRIFAMRNAYQLTATFLVYQKVAGKDIISSIESEMSGDLKSSLKALAIQAINKPLYFARRLNACMAGAGTSDQNLVRIILSRSEIDLANIKDAYKHEFKKTLEQAICEDTSGDYKNFLVRFVAGN